MLVQVEANGLRTSYAYAPRSPVTQGQATRITQQRPGEPASILTDHYRTDGTLALQERDGHFLGYVAYDTSLAPTAMLDSGGNLTRIESNPVGHPTHITDALGRTTTVEYINDVIQSPTNIYRPHQIQAWDGPVTTLAYDAQGNVLTSTMTAPANPTVRLVTAYEYTADNRLQQVTAPNGVRTRYTYFPSGPHAGQVQSRIDGDGTTAAITTTYTYDALGRRTRTTVGAGTPLVRTTETRYHADNSVFQTIQNAVPGAPATAETNLTTTYGYDALGRTIWVRDALGHYAVVHYTADGLVEWTAQNYTVASFDPANPDSLTKPTYDPATPDQNVLTEYTYDGRRQRILTTQHGIATDSSQSTVSPPRLSAPTTRTTRVEYDQLSRPITVTLNYRPDQPVHDPNDPTSPVDVNLQTVTYYDAAGNVAWTMEPLGRWTHMAYDALNRPITTTVNYADGIPTANEVDRDVQAIVQYDAAGRVAERIDNYVDGVLEVGAFYDGTDQRTSYTYDALGRLETTIRNPMPNSTSPFNDSNQTTRTAYDPRTGQVHATQDPLGRWTALRYDDLGRVGTRIVNCYVDNPTPDGDACYLNSGTFNGTAPDRNRVYVTRYDALGRAYETGLEDPAGDLFTRLSRTNYDALGRVSSTIQNYDDGVFDPTEPDTDVGSGGTTYDALGRVRERTDAEGGTTAYEVNALGSTTAITDATGRVTRMGYDGTGLQHWSAVQEPDASDDRGWRWRITRSVHDGLGRVVTTVVNPGRASGRTDGDVTTRTIYDAAGRVRYTEDANGRFTRFAYDAQDRLVSVTENSDPPTTSGSVARCLSYTNIPGCDWEVTTRYDYDHAGNLREIGGQPHGGVDEWGADRGCDLQRGQPARRLAL
ncbi:MAG: RHS repeat protein [Chloroflexaceae bacterium]|nr:RHS repeat protein [Chloroflexaceae bacterium]